ncbi:Retrotransposon-derived protein peg10 [Entomophthora muscae]|uniref:Retrotransposon-derived protein peg10 n=1 Tax=Entomophthora muscae TaxID=34485 RepID=A0ACC2STR8_9FUNG|nr:Retrotransposon-derived protein peg10 [Entomophthora muscae]
MISSVSSLLSFSGEDKDSSFPLLPSLQVFHKDLSHSLLQDRPQQIALGIFGSPQPPQSIRTPYQRSGQVEPKIPSLETHPSSNLDPAARKFVSDKVLLYSTPPPGTKPKAEGGFCLTAKEVLKRRNNNLCSYCGSKDHLLPACPLSKCSPFVNKTSTLTSLSLSNTSKSPTILVTIHGPLGKIKVLALLDTGADANFIEEKLANLIGLPTSRSLDVKVENSTLTSTIPIL